MNRFLPMLACLCFLAPAVAWAVEPDEIMDDPALEARARAISQHLRCLVCQNETIDDSGAELAKDLRLLVRERLAAGDSDEEVIQFIVDRYGDFVLLRPPVQPNTWALWFGPLVVLTIGVFSVIIYVRRFREVPGTGDDLTEEERRQVRALLEKETEGP